MKGWRIIIANMGTDHSSINNPHANTGKSDLGDASKDLKDVAKFVDDDWDKADDSAWGKVAGRSRPQCSTSAYASQLSQNTCIAIPNHTTEAGSLSLSLAPGMFRQSHKAWCEIPTQCRFTSGEPGCAGLGRRPCHRDTAHAG